MTAVLPYETEGQAVRRAGRVFHLSLSCKSGRLCWKRCKWTQSRAGSSAVGREWARNSCPQAPCQSPGASMMNYHKLSGLKKAEIYSFITQGGQEPKIKVSAGLYSPQRPVAGGCLAPPRLWCLLAILGSMAGNCITPVLTPSSRGLLSGASFRWRRILGGHCSARYGPSLVAGVHRPLPCGCEAPPPDPGQQAAAGGGCTGLGCVGWGLCLSLLSQLSQKHV